MGVAVVTPTSAAARPIDVVAHTTVDLDATVQGRLLTVQGTVRDNVGTGLGFAGVDLTLRSGDRVRVERLTSDRHGRFGAAFELDDGTWSVDARYTGGEFVDAAEAESSFEVAYHTPTITLIAQPFMASGAEQLTLHLAVRDGDEPLSDVPVYIDSDCSTEPSAAVTNALGYGSVVLTVATVDAFCSIVVDVESAPRHDSARYETDVRVVEDASIDISATRLRGSVTQGRSVLLDGTAADAYGGLANAPVRITINRPDGETSHVDAVTNERGVYRIAVEERDIGSQAVNLVATLALDGIDTRSTTLRYVPGGAALRVFPIISLAGVAVVALALLLAFANERRRARPVTNLAKQASQRPRIPTVGTEIDGSLDGSGELVGVVRDAHTKQRLVGVSVTITHAANPVGQTVVTDRDGRFMCDRSALNASNGAASNASTTEAATLQITLRKAGFLPVDGLQTAYPAEGRRLSVSIISVRSYVRDVMTEVSVSLKSDIGEWWGVDTIQEVTPKLRDSISILLHDPTGPIDHTVHSEALNGLLDALQRDPSKHAAVQALSMLVDEVYFSGTVYDADVADTVDRLALIVAEPTPRGAR